MEMDTVQLRFRHTSGDVGPYSFPLGHTILQVKEGVFSQWPREGPLSKENPSSAADLRILCAGKFLDNAKILRDYSKEMGDPESGSIVTMHILVRPAQATKAAGKTESQPKPAGEQGCCSCVIS